MKFLHLTAIHRQLKAWILLLATLITTFGGVAAMADDTEIFYGSTATASAPNIMLILDTSGSMDTNVTTAVAYDAGTTYTWSAGSCDSSYVYYATNSTVPTCSTTNRVLATQFYCSPATTGWSASSSSSSSSASGVGAFGTVGYYSDYATRWMTSTTTSTVTSTPTVKTAVSTVVKRYTAGSSASSTYSSSSSSSTSTGSATSSTASTATYTWQAAFSKSASSSSSTASSVGSTSSVSSSTSSINVSTSSPSRTWKTEVTTTTTTVTTTTTNVTSSNTSYTMSNVACFTDEPNTAGASPASTGYPNGVSPTSANQWTSTSANSYWNNGGSKTTTYYFYTANYINYFKGGNTTITQTRLKIMQSAISTLLNSSSGINVGLMRYDAKGNGGMVTQAMGPISSVKSAISTEVNSWEAEGNTPLTESLYEAYLYFAGKDVYFGRDSYTFFKSSSSAGCTYSATAGGYYCSKPSVAAARVSSSSSASKYDSPMDYSCQKNYAVFLTDGEPNADTSANTLINSMRTSASSSISSCNTGTSGACLSTLTTYMYGNDLNSSVAETQNVTTYFIGLGSDFTGSSSSATSAFTYLETAGKAGGGTAYSADDLNSLSAVFNKIFNSIKTDASTFTSPSVAVNAFNKTQVLEDLYYSVFQPSANRHWPGNVKKYKFVGGAVVDKNYAPAVDSTAGFFKATSPDFWSSSATQNNLVTVGGAANLIPAPASRTVYTYIGSNPSSSPYVASMQSFNTANSSITSTMLGVSSAMRDTLINWARGVDVQDEDADGDTTDARHAMGDPIHSQPTIVIYGNDSSATTTTAKINDALIYLATNDGYLHAIDVSTGVEKWAFIPQDALGNLINLYDDEAGDTKQYILDGNLRTYKYDVDGDGVVDTADGDRVFLYFSQGRGGSSYYALDITDKNAPKFAWRLGAESLPDIGKSWSTPAVGRVKINDGSTQNNQRLVLIFGGGYDLTEETPTYTAADTSGRALYMVDAVRGTVLWSGGYPGIATSGGTTASQNFAGMDHAIPSDITIVDTDGDGYTDRMYVGDMAGQLWRFDITNGSTASSLVAGGVIASLGSHDETTHILANNRRFYNAPDVALFNPKKGASYYNIAIGSGYRGHPLSTAIADRFYTIRDYNPYTKLTQSIYNTYTKVTDSALTDITSNVYSSTTPTIAAGTPGWKIILNGTGEKMLSSSVTVSGAVLFTSYIPSSSTASCNPAAGKARSYAVNVQTGTNKFSSAYEEYIVSGLPSTTQIINNAALIATSTSSSSASAGSSGSSGSAGSSGSSGSSGSTSSGSPGLGGGGTSSSSSASSGGSCIGPNGKVLLNCPDAPQRSKTFWRENGAN
ncbi:MAG: PilC/PilY family type IV pilus protein [Steroidobacteraceae bacterium]